MKIVFNGVQVTVAKGSSVNLANGVIEVNMTQPKTKKVVSSVQTTSVAERCRSAFKNKSKGSTVMIEANRSDTIRHAFDSMGVKVSIRRTEDPTTFLVKKV